MLAAEQDQRTDATRIYVTFSIRSGAVLAVMAVEFSLLAVLLFAFAAPTIAAGKVALLNQRRERQRRPPRPIESPCCAMAGSPYGVFQTPLVPGREPSRGTYRRRSRTVPGRSRQASARAQYVPMAADAFGKIACPSSAVIRSRARRPPIRARRHAAAKSRSSIPGKLHRGRSVHIAVGPSRMPSTPARSPTLCGALRIGNPPRSATDVGPAGAGLLTRRAPRQFDDRVPAGARRLLRASSFPDGCFLRRRSKQGAYFRGCRLSTRRFFGPRRRVIIHRRIGRGPHRARETGLDNCRHPASGPVTPPTHRRSLRVTPHSQGSDQSMY